MKTIKTITEFQIVDGGIDHEQYFQGCGVACTDYDFCFTGIGDNPKEALSDAIEQLATSGEFEVSKYLEEEEKNMPETPSVSEIEGNEEMHYYISIRVK